MPDLLIGAYSDGGSQVFWEDGERVFRRLDDNGKRAVLLVMPAADQPSRSSLDRLIHEYELKDELSTGRGRSGRSSSCTSPVGPYWCSRMWAASRADTRLCQSVDELDLLGDAEFRDDTRGREREQLLPAGASEARQIVPNRCKRDGAEFRIADGACNKLTHFRVIAARYDKLARNFLAVNHLASAIILLN